MPQECDWRSRMTAALRAYGMEHPGRSPRLARMHRASGFALIVAAELLLFMWWYHVQNQCDDGYSLPTVICDGERQSQEAVFWLGFGVMAAIVGFAAPYLIISGQRGLAPTASYELDRLPEQRPILLLRSFERDRPFRAMQWIRAPGDIFETMVVKYSRRTGL